jgi:F-type H+-transporting ATPase subunit c
MRKTMEKMAVALLTFIAAVPAFAQEVATTAGAKDAGMLAIGAGLAIGIAAFGGAQAQSKTAAAALEGIARNPAAQDKIFTPMIVALALIEALVILAFLIALFLNQKIG